VFVTKYRRPVFTDQMLIDCEKLMRNVCSDLSVIIHEFGGESDHVHLMVQIPPTVARNDS
jgi:putative transposase